MKREENIIDMYYKYIEEKFNCKISDELLGKKYVIGQQFGVGNFSRMKIDEGIEISKVKLNKTDLYFDNSTFEDNILEEWFKGILLLEHFCFFGVDIDSDYHLQLFLGGREHFIFKKDVNKNIVNITTSKLMVLGGR